MIATMSYLVLAAVTTAVLSYPTGINKAIITDCFESSRKYENDFKLSGPPNCDSVPNHSGGKGDEISLSLVDIGEGVWNVSSL